MNSDRSKNPFATGSFSGTRRRLLQGAGAAAATGLTSQLIPGVAHAADPVLGVVSFPGPSISSHSKVIIKKNGLDKKHDEKIAVYDLGTGGICAGSFAPHRTLSITISSAEPTNPSTSAG